MSNRELESLLRTQVTQPVFARVGGDAVEVGVPPRVLANRRERAEALIVDALALRGTAVLSPVMLHRVESLVRDWQRVGWTGTFEPALEFELELARALADPETSHRQALRERWGHVELFGLQASARIFQDLDLLYVPQRLRSQRTRSASVGDHTVEIPILVGQDGVVEFASRVVVHGKPGSGKSTLLQRIATTHNDRIPFVVQCRLLDEGIDLEAIAHLNGCAVPWLREVLQAGRGLLLVDGLDEVPGGPAAPWQAVDRLLEGFADTRVVLTLRTAPFRALLARKAEVLEGYEPLALLDLEASEVSDFVHRWCRAAEVSVADVRSRATAEQRGRRAAEDLLSRLSRSKAAADLARTPLLAAVLCVVHRFVGQRIPERRTALYEACSNVLLHEWDASKFPEDAPTGRLDLPQKRLLLARLAVHMHTHEAGSLTDGELERLLGEHLPELGLSARDAPAIVDEIRHRNGVLVEQAPGRFAFSHLTFQEYLAAVGMVQGRRVDELVAQAHAEHWREVVLLAAGLPDGPVGPIIKGLLDRKERVADVMAGLAVGVAVAVPRSLRKEVRERLVDLLPPRSAAALQEVAELGKVVGPLLVPLMEDEDPNVRAWTLSALVACGYEGVGGVLVASNGDRGTVKEEVWLPMAGVGIVALPGLVDWGVGSFGFLLILTNDGLMDTFAASMRLDLGSGGDWNGIFLTLEATAKSLLRMASHHPGKDELESVLQTNLAIFKEATHPPSPPTPDEPPH